MRIILFGPPGSGKGTQGDLIERKYGFPKISTGDLLRQAVRDKTSLGKRAQVQMSRGKLVNDEIVDELVRERTGSPDCRPGYLLDGYPRNLAQVRSLEVMDGGRPEIAIEMVIDLAVLLRRLESRRICSRCSAVYNLELQKPGREGECDICGGALVQRQDDEPAVIRERMKVYQDETEKIKDHYVRKGVFRQVAASGSIEEVFQRISCLLDARLTELREKKASL